MPILEGVYDIGNVLAVCRSTEALGVGCLGVISDTGLVFKQSGRGMQQQCLAPRGLCDVGISPFSPMPHQAPRLPGYWAVAWVACMLLGGSLGSLHAIGR
jgi:hypothetical protein